MKPAALDAAVDATAKPDALAPPVPPSPHPSDADAAAAAAVVAAAAGVKEDERRRVEAPAHRQDREAGCGRAHAAAPPPPKAKPSFLRRLAPSWARRRRSGAVAGAVFAARGPSEGRQRAHAVRDRPEHTTIGDDADVAQLAAAARKFSAEHRNTTSQSRLSDRARRLFAVRGVNSAPLAPCPAAAPSRRPSQRPRLTTAGTCSRSSCRPRLSPRPAAAGLRGLPTRPPAVGVGPPVASGDRPTTADAVELDCGAYLRRGQTRDRQRRGRRRGGAARRRRTRAPRDDDAHARHLVPVPPLPGRTNGRPASPRHVEERVDEVGQPRAPALQRERVRGHRGAQAEREGHEPDEDGEEEAPVAWLEFGSGLGGVGSPSPLGAARSRRRQRPSPPPRRSFRGPPRRRHRSRRPCRGRRTRAPAASSHCPGSLCGR